MCEWVIVSLCALSSYNNLEAISSSLTCNKPYRLYTLDNALEVFEENAKNN